ncbi:cytosolic endo-beta-N-acetylglucosaminidase-like [Anneissia japonica]|uniref:cytosolic endo-beta-N-acetylglucosaminidase-like n=1 Tax=Anneissia japonica TaxID=1529436 RepID=UPI00142587C7|nr:cytosolic endo-beta-N-acetylglucosaminidase-like [Anneissia japonica]
MAEMIDSLASEIDAKINISPPVDFGPGYEPKTSEPIARPLSNMDEVLLWKPGEDEFNVASEVLARRTESSVPKPKTLVCHDMMGGYVDDRFVQGVAKNDCYRFYHWQYIDIFMYFSHHFLTIPPAPWTNAAHKNGTLMLGTFITEWKDGAERCKQVLASEDAYKCFADKMVALAKYYRFDGWLINVENQIEPEQMPYLVEFVEYLTSEMHKLDPVSQVIWYDSVIQTGKLKWQDMLNDNNRLFFDRCDGIFLNYNWNEQKLKDSLQMAGDRKYDVYVGVDIFGRGCFGGGGWNTYKAMEVIRKVDLSAAIFAPGWVFEKHGATKFIPNENRFWSLIESYLHSHGVVSLPLCSNFCQGYGVHGFSNGKKVMTKKWCNLSAQQIQPSFSNKQFEDGAKQKMDRLVTDGYSGGGCLSFDGSLEAGKTHIFKVLQTGIEWKDFLLIAYSVKTSSQMKIELYLQTAEPDGQIVLTDTEDISKAEKQNVTDYGLHESEKLADMPAAVFAPLGGASLTVLKEMSGNIPESNGWVTRYYLLSKTAFDCAPKITEIGLKCSSLDVPVIYNVLLGQIKILDPAELKESTTQVTDLTCQDITWSPPIISPKSFEGLVSICITIKWKYAISASHFDVFVKGVTRSPNENMELSVYEPVFVGRSHSKQFRICHLLVPQKSEQHTLEIMVLPTNKAGFQAPWASVASVKVKYS